jgi:hypothetical protein
MGAGAACLALGLTLGALALGKADTYATEGPSSERRELRSSGESLALAADVMLGTGVAFAGTGLVLYLVRLSSGPPPAAPEGPEAAWMPRAAGLQGAVRW